MFLSDTSIDRPVMSVMVIGVLVIFGVLSLMYLPVRELPDVDPPVVNITIPYPGANPRVVEEEVSEPIEEEVNTIQGIKTLTSSSGSGGSNITVEFTLDRDIDVAVQDVRDKINSIRGRLPEQVDEPVIEKVNPDERPIMWISVNSPDRDQIELSTYADEHIKPKLEHLKGVGKIRQGGLRDFSVRVYLDPTKLASYNMTVNDVRNALLTQNRDLPSGRIEGTCREFTIRTEGDIDKVEKFNDLVIGVQNGSQIELEDVGYAERGPRETRRLAHFTKPGKYVGRTSVGLGVVRQTGSNTVAVINRVKEELKSVKKNSPSAITIQIASDDSVYIQQSIDNLKEHLLLGGLLAAFVVFVFLASGRPGIITIISIPTSIISSFSVMYFFGFSLNNLTMLAMILAVGIVVDDSIVVMENIFRHMQEGKGKLRAAREGASEIAFAVLAASVTVAIVFMPLLFVSGIVGQYFMEFSVSVAGAIMISYIVSLTVIPMLGSRYLKEDREKGKFYQAVHGAMNNLTEKYTYLLRKSLNWRKTVIAVAVVILVLTAVLYQSTGKEMAPKTDESQFIIFMKGPQGATVDYMKKYLSEVENLIAEQPEVRTMFSAIGLGGFGQPSSAIGFVRLKPLEYRQENDLRGQQKLMDDLRGQLFAIPGFLAFPTEPSRGSSTGKPLQLAVQAEDYQKLFETSEKIERALKKVDGIVDVDSDLNLNKPKIRVIPDRKKAADLGVSLNEISNTLRVLTGGDDITEFERDGERYDVMVQLEKDKRSIPDHIGELYVKSGTGKQIPLTSLVDVEEYTGPETINHYNRSRAVTVEANTSGIALREALRIAQEKTRSIADENLKSGYEIAVTGQSQDMKEMFENFFFIFLLASVLIYMVLAGQFDHFVHPLTIMVSLPLCLVGAIGFLWLLDFTVSMPSIIGTLMLFGIILRNAILLVDYANLAQREKGMELFEASIEAGRVRLRPILMTGLSTIGGVLPTLLGLGSGAEIQRPLAAAVVGGMIAGNILTLFVVPVIYTYMERLTDFALNLVRDGKPHEAPSVNQ